ncbi:MAG: hypothetical protein A3F70_10725 [Acidobacteria bacterium RIFCSPLOWO2_12_FULL_67_14]|nr:MAG: hypothetical protein A3F70_10725 [Acidobacteria bacterium RIFCSPLOWO2_12_FULL_67_14]
MQDVIDAVRESAPSKRRVVELEFHQLDLRYERLRVRQPARERRLLASLADVGQQTPIVVVTTAARYVVVDGHKRVRCLRRLHRDTVTAVAWEMPEPEALIFRQVLHTDATDSALEQGWLLRTLHEDHRLPLQHLARRFDRSVSWVSWRLSLDRRQGPKLFAFGLRIRSRVRRVERLPNHRGFQALKRDGPLGGDVYAATLAHQQRLQATLRLDLQRAHPLVVACPTDAANRKLGLVNTPRFQSYAASFSVNFGCARRPELICKPKRPSIFERVGVARAEEALAHACSGRVYVSAHGTRSASASGAERQLEVQSLCSLEVVDDLEEIAGLRVTAWT